MWAIDMSGGCETRPIPDVHSRKLAFILCTKPCRKRRKFLRRSCSSRAIQRCLTDGLLRAGRLGPTARPSALRRNPLAMRMQTKYAPAQRATKYLKRVAALTGAQQVRGDSYWLRTGRRDFLVDHKFVRLISHHGKSTCFSIAADPDMPSAEVVASALLHLNNNPRLFKKWRKQPGSTFKANGKVFRGTYQLSRDET